MVLRAGVWKGLVLVHALCAASLADSAQAQPAADPYEFDDREIANIEHPAWFKDSLLNLRDDLEDARQANKLGIVLFFSERTCSYCKKFLNTTLADPAIRQDLQNRFDVIGLEVLSDLEITDVAGRAQPVKDFALSEGARFTPTLVFYAIDGTRMVRIVGYYPPDKFRGVLAYVAGGHYKQEPLAAFLSRREPARPAAGAALVRDEELFQSPPLHPRPACSAGPATAAGDLRSAGL